MRASVKKDYNFVCIIEVGSLQEQNWVLGEVTCKRVVAHGKGIHSLYGLLSRDRMTYGDI